VVKETTTDEEFADLRLRKIGFVFQTFNLIASMTALENVSLPMVLDGSKSSAEIKARATMLLESVGMGDRTDHLPSQLSGGEQQRVTIARAISNKPKILLLDEPTGDLDTHNSNIILNLLLQLNRVEGITCVMVTHDRALKNFSHRTVHMIDGKINYIEEISQSVRQETDRQLREDIANKNHRNATATAEVTTEVRDVAHYAHGACRPLPPL
jgi:putative ABC transport system ATP-binding protein